MSKTPKHTIIENYIIEKINDGKLKHGDHIQTEAELSKLFGISRLTVNKALVNLQRQGYIRRVAGKGSFVLSKVSRSINATRSFSDDMKSIGMKPGSVLIEYKIQTTSSLPNVQRALKLGNSDEVYSFIRLRTGDGEPVALSYSYIPCKLLPDFDISVLNGSLSEYLRSRHITIAGFKTQMSAVISSERQQEILHITEKALLKSMNTRYMDGGVPYEYTETFYISDKFEYCFQYGKIE